ncbi:MULTISPECIES: TadE/TadG family type IV pilus assembly protein [unclassified Kitasatospora]|uniref:TadE/TadG family type IV pilus assembly protein n=1 Tax=unclassified Kitasatospora TaxID=2633591 RepID=UPI002E311882|nr:TadE/TadG family type IV pilus assembly protein [Kitasatospora sp. NBC_01246]
MSLRPARSARGRDRGGVAIEAAIVAPGVVALVLVAIAAGRVQTAAGTVEAAARSAARTASLARSVDGMDELVRKTAAETLRQQGVSCRDSDTAVKHGELTSHGVTLATVEVTVRCDVGLSDLLAGPGMPGTKRLVGRFVSVVDHYRAG